MNSESNAIWKNITYRVIATCWISLSFLSGCNSAVPSESEGKAILEKFIAKKISDYQDNLRRWPSKVPYRKRDIPFTIVFKKTDGIKRTFAGQELYRMVYDAEITFPKGLSNVRCQSGFGRPPCNVNLETGLADIPPVAPGGSHKIKGKFVDFTKSEKGWTGRVSFSSF